jgi:hypothetical protein
LYSDNQALEFITRQEKLNQRHEKWVDLMHNFTFIIKHIAGNDNKVEFANMQKEKYKTMDCINHCQYQRGRGMQ